MPVYVVELAAAGNAAEAGGKGASLGELARAGAAVPPGFVLTTGAFAAALAAIDPDGALRASVEALPAAELTAIARVAAAFRERIVRRAAAGFRGVGHLVGVRRSRVRRMGSGPLVGHDGGQLRRLVRRPAGHLPRRGGFAFGA